MSIQIHLKNSSHYLIRPHRKTQKNKFWQRTITPVKNKSNTTKLLTWSVLSQNKFIYKISNHDKTQNLICIMLWQIHTPNFKSISQTTTEKIPENWILAKGNNSPKSRSSVTKLKLDLYYVMINSYTKFQVNISKDDREKSGKLKCDGRTDCMTDRRTNWLTDSEQTKSPSGKPVGD